MQSLRPESTDAISNLAASCYMSAPTCLDYGMVISLLHSSIRDRILDLDSDNLVCSPRYVSYKLVVEFSTSQGSKPQFPHMLIRLVLVLQVYSGGECR